MGDWTSLTYVISQVLMLFVYSFCAFTYLVKRRGWILFGTICANATMAAALCLLSAWSGVVICCAAIARDLVNALIDRKRTPEQRKKVSSIDFILLAFWTAVFVTLNVLSYDGIWSLFPMFGAVAFTVSICQKNVLVYRLLGVFVSAVWLIYQIAISSLIGVILESALLVAVFIGLIAYWRSHIKKTNTRYR